MGILKHKNSDYDIMVSSKTIKYWWWMFECLNFSNDKE